MPTKTDRQAPAPHVADRHEMIRVHGARVNNLRDVNVEIPKRRLTVFTGVSGSGKSSLVFGTIAAESQRLINETYSAFVQGFMPTLARPEVDVLDGLTTAIIVDQERMGTNPRSTVGTATDANAMLRILFSRLGKPHIGSPQAFAFNVPSVRASGAITVERGEGKTKTERASFTRLGGMCPRCEGMGRVSDFDLTQMYDENKSLNEGALDDPRLQHGRLVRPHLPRLRLLRSRQADQEVHQEGAARPALQGADQDQGRGHQPHVRGTDPVDREVDAVQGRRRAAAAHPGVRGAGRHVHQLPRVRGHAAQRAGPDVEDQGDQHRRRLRDADHRPRRLGPCPRRAVGRAVARGAAADPRLVRRDRARLPLAGAAGGHPLGRRVAAHEDDPPPRLVAHGRHVRLRRAHHRDAPPRRPADERSAAAAAGQGQHGARRGARAGDDRHRRPRRRPRPRRRFGGRHDLLRRPRREAAGQRHHHRPPPRRPDRPQGRGADGDRRAGDPWGRHPQPAEGRRRHPPRRAVRDHRRGRLRQELADPGVRRRPGRRGDGRSGSDQGLAAQQPGDVHRRARADPQGVRQGQRREAGAVQRQLRGRLPRTATAPA